MKKGLFGTCILIFVLGVGLVSGCSGNEPAKVDKQSEGYKLYSQNCSACHGADLQGGAGPNLAHIGANLSEDRIALQIKNGGGGMPSFAGKLDAQTVQNLAGWLSQVK